LGILAIASILKKDPVAVANAENARQIREMVYFII